MIYNKIHGENEETSFEDISEQFSDEQEEPEDELSEYNS